MMNVLLDPRTCERARLARDPRFDGRFFLGVRSTGIYCRPICPAPAARAENVEYFMTAAAAAEAGFRPCLRCRPETAPGTPAWQGTSTTVSRALRLIADGALDAGSVEELASRLGVTSRHLARLFRQHLGASPLAVATTRRLQFAKRLIDDTDMKFADIAAAAGFGSLRRFNAAVRATWNRSPSELRKLRRPLSAASGISLRISCRAPFDWQHWLDFLARRAIPGVERVDGSSYARVVVTQGGTGRLRITPDDHGAFLNIEGVPPVELFQVVRKARALLDADADPLSIIDTLREDDSLRRHVEARPGIRVPGAYDAFELAVRAVLGQQISVAAARTLAARIVTHWGEAVAEPREGLTHVFPAPEALAGAPLESIGLPAKRADALRALARAFANGVIDLDAEPQAVREQLVALPGIGEWTAHYISMRALRDPDALPAADLVLRKMLGNGAPLATRQVEWHSQRWRPWRAYALMHLWAAATDHASTREAS